MKVLLVGGTGVISSGSHVEILSRGYELYLLNRGNSTARVTPGAKVLVADYNDEEACKKAIGDHVFDTVVDFRIMNVEGIEKAVRIFSGHTKQYIFISSGTVYKKPLPSYIITEDAPLGNIHSAYARNKLAAEYALRLHIDKGFPGVIVRPSLTYSDFNPLTSLNSRKHPYTLIHRMRKGKPSWSTATALPCGPLPTTPTLPGASWACSAIPIPSAKLSTSPATKCWTGIASTPIWPMPQVWTPI